MLRTTSLCMLLLLAAAPLKAHPTVRVPFGQVMGQRRTVEGKAVDEFLGLRYGRAARFEPAHREHLRGTTRATKRGMACPGSETDFPESEDCLFLDVSRPALHSRKRLLPVMVYFHGGSFSTGSGVQYDGASIVGTAQHDVIVVVANYRLNVFGFLGSEELRQADNSTGNLGLQDQRQVLYWVRSNIKFFGGDRRRVTIFGQSAGAAAISAHMVAPRSRGLFHQVAAESGLAATWGTQSMAQSEARYQETLEATGCDGVDCLRSLPFRNLSQAVEDFTAGVAYDIVWGPTIDGVELQKHLQEHFRDGDHDRTVAVLTGTQRDEAALFSAPYSGLNDNHVAAFFLSRLVANPEEDLPQVFALYATQREYPAVLGNHGQLWWTVTAALTDALFFCQTRRALQWMRQHHQTAPVYAYMAVHPTKSRTAVYIDGPEQVTVPHDASRQYTFNCARYPSVHDCAWDVDADADLARQASRFWSSFAATGVPGRQWCQEFNEETGSLFVLDADVSHGGEGFRYIDNDPRAAVCDFWDAQLDTAFLQRY